MVLLISDMYAVTKWLSFTFWSYLKFGNCLKNKFNIMMGGVWQHWTRLAARQYTWYENTNNKRLITWFVLAFGFNWFLDVSLFWQFVLNLLIKEGLWCYWWCARSQATPLVVVESGDVTISAAATDENITDDQNVIDEDQETISEMDRNSESLS